MDIGKNIAEIKQSLPDEVKLVAVSKKKLPEIIMQAYNAGQKIFGENKAQELIQKQEELPNDIEWHFIGHLQTNKAKYLTPFVSMIHGIDSLKILKTVNKEAQKNNREILDSPEYKTLRNVSIVGVMGMATFTDNEEQVRNEFRFLKKIFDKLKKEYFPRKKGFKEISMGMSDDYAIAVEEGSTIVRIGSNIFGAR